jgi:hypothetical protein
MSDSTEIKQKVSNDIVPSICHYNVEHYLVRQPDVVLSFQNNPISQDLMTIPGIGKAAVSKLNANNITRTDHLIGSFFLVERDEGKFTRFLEEMEIRNHCAREAARNFVKKFSKI